MFLLVALALRLCVSINQELWIGSAGRYYIFREGAALGFAGLVVVFALERGALSRALSHPAAIRLGEISFALYLVHTMVLIYFEKLSGLMSEQYLWVWCIGYWAVCLTIAYAMFIGVEQPVRATILSLAKRYIKHEKRQALPPMLPLAKQMALGGAIMLSTVLIAKLLKTHDLAGASNQQEISNGTIVQASFGQKFSLEKLRICSISEATVEFAYSLRPLTQSQFANERMGIHLMNASGEILSSLDHEIDEGIATLDENKSWIHRVRFSAIRLKDVSMFGFAMYTDVKNLYPIRTAGKTDWGGKRLILPMPNHWKDTCNNS